MKFVRIVTVIAALGVSSVYAQEKKTYVGIITDSMCTIDHAAMKIAPQDKCVRDCVGDGRTYKYALTDGKVTYLLSDQETPARFAGRKVKVIGVLYTKTNILKVESISAVRVH
ncbi:MAG TPA: hypothetical protein VEL51_23470 [Vicinamibacterales bacterium]|nr:hypothetical protein [Vicinamibacterales bacterium]